MMKVATFHSRDRSIEYWTSHNTVTFVHCDKWAQAKRVLEALIKAGKAINQHVVKA